MGVFYGGFCFVYGIWNFVLEYKGVVVIDVVLLLYKVYYFLVYEV